jgi:HK97 family phage portal protein
MAKKAPAKAPAKRAAPSRRTPRRRSTAMPKARVVNLRSSVIGLTGGDYWSNFSSSSIGPTEAIRVTSILGVVRWIAQAVAIMPVHLMRTDPDGRKRSVDLPCAYTIRKRPNPWQSAYDFYQLIAYWTALHGNGFARILPGERGWCSELRPMHPTRVKVHRDADYRVWYEFWDNDGQWKPLDADEVLHFRWLSDNGLVGLPPAELCETSIALARKLDQAATSFWDNSARPDMVLETDEKIPDEAVVALREALREVYGGPSNRGKTAVLPKKTRLKAIESNSMEANQFQELRDAILPDVCRCWGVPSTLLGDSKMARWSNVEQEGLFAQTWTLLPWMRRMEGPLDMALQPVYGEDIYTRFDNRGILRGDTSSRVALYQQMFNMGSIRPNEIRDLEDFDLLDDPAANETYMQLGFSTLANAAAAADPAPAAPLEGEQ